MKLAFLVAVSLGAPCEAWFGLLPRQKCREKSQNAGFLRRSCSRSWNAAGRCKWLTDVDGCMTNCKHPQNQNSQLCDPTDCVWSEGSCSFANSTVSAREDFCGRVTNVLSNDQATFCDGVPLNVTKREIQPMDRSIDIMEFMGCWYVQANIPTFLDAGSSNNIELYEWNTARNRIDITFQYTKNGKDTIAYQKGYLVNEQSTQWRLHPRLLWIYWPFNLPYLLVHIDDNFTETIIGYPDRSYLWIMTREVNPAAAKVENLIQMAVDLGYRRENINMVQNNISTTPEICPQ